MRDDDTERKIYRQPLNYENGVLVPKIRDISYWRDTDIKAYESGIITLVLLLPNDIRQEALEFWNKGTIYDDLTMDGKKDFDDLFVFILKKLEEYNIIIPKISFEVGHD